MPNPRKVERVIATTARTKPASLGAVFGSLDAQTLKGESSRPAATRTRQAKQPRAAASHAADSVPAASQATIAAEEEREGATDRSDGPLEDVASDPKLSPAAKRVLLALFDPAHFGASYPELAEATGCSERQIANIMTQRVFADAVKAIFNRQLSRSAGAILDAAVKSALIPGRDGYQDRKMLLEMAGLYTGPVRRHVHEGKIGVEHQVGSRLTRALSLREQVVRQIEQAGEGDDAIIDADYSVDGDDPAPVEGPDDANPLTDMDDAA